MTHHPGWLVDTSAIRPHDPVLQPIRTEARAREVQRELTARGQHRAVAVPDLLVAAVAEAEGLTVLHHDGDFDLIAAMTGQPTE